MIFESILDVKLGFSLFLTKESVTEPAGEKRITSLRKGFGRESWRTGAGPPYLFSASLM